MTVFGICGNCEADLREGDSFFYDSTCDEYYCDRACHEDWYADNYAEYVRKNCEVVTT